MRGSGGLIHGSRVVLVLVATPVESIKNSVPLSSAVCLILSSGLQNTLHWTVSRFVGLGSSARLAGMLINIYGKIIIIIMMKYKIDGK